MNLILPKESGDPDSSKPPDIPDPPDHPDIPQTGVNWWLTWLLAAAGVLLILAGIGKELWGKNKH